MAGVAIPRRPAERDQREPESSASARPQRSTAPGRRGSRRKRRFARVEGGKTGRPQTGERASSSTGDWLVRWLDQRCADGALGPRTAENYRAILRCHLVARLGTIPLNELDREDVASLKEELSRKLAPATVHKVLGLLRKSLNEAVTEGQLQGNPAESVTSPTVAGRSRERRALTSSEIIALLQAADGTPYDTSGRFALATGIRQSELLGARWDSVDLELGTFAVERSVHHVDGQFIVRTPKTRHSRRTIELSAATVAMMRRHRERQGRHEVRSDLDLVFPDAVGGYQHRRTFLTGFRRILAKSGIEDERSVNFHSLRHTAASMWIKAGVDLLIVSRRLGHGSASFTMDVYGHMLPGQQRAAAEALDHLMS